MRLAAFALILVGAALIPAPVRAGEALEESAMEPQSRSASPAGAELAKANEAHRPPPE